MLLKNKLSVLVCVLILSLSAFAAPQDSGAVSAADAALVQAATAQKRVNFISAKNLVVSEILKSDTSGSPHQKFNVKLSNGRVIMIVSNLDMCEKVPVQVGDLISAGGQFIPTGHASGLLHWTHKDPRKNRPDGFIELNGHVYCQ